MTMSMKPTSSTLIRVAVSLSTMFFCVDAKGGKPRTIVVGSGPGGTGFIKRAIQHASCEDNFEWFEEGEDDVVLDWPTEYHAPGSERYIKRIDRKEGQGQAGDALKAIRLTALGGGAVLNSGGPLTLMDIDDERFQSAVDQHGPSFLAEELQSQIFTEASSTLIDWYKDIGYEVKSDFLTTRKADQANRVGYGASALSGGRRTQVAKTLISDNPNRINLHLRTRVKRVVFGSARDAIGIELMNGTVVTGDRVVLAGGVFGTYELLVRSGIGSKEDLDTVGVDEIVADESVGKNIGDDAGILFLHGNDGQEVHASDGSWHGVVASRGNQFGITHWGNLVFSFLLLGLGIDYGTSNSTPYDFLRPLADNTSLVKIDLPATYNSSVSIKYDGTLVYDDSKNYRDEICVDEPEFGVLNGYSAPNPIITGLAAQIGMAISTPDMQCSNGLLSSNYHYHGGSQGVINSNFSVKGTHNTLYISDASVTDKYTYGAPTTNVYMIGYAVADAVYHTTSTSTVSTMESISSSSSSSSSPPPPLPLPEIFPLVLGVVLLACNFAFTAFTLWVVFKKRAENKIQDKDATTGEERFGGMGSKRSSSWVYVREDAEANVNEHGEEKKVETVGEMMMKEEEEEEAIMSWKELSCSYPSKRSGAQNTITTLSNVTGHVRYQELVAIMGGSGGGKSTLMDILSGRKTLGNVSGEMSVLGTEMSPCSVDCKNVLRDVAAYVPQNEQFFPNQTPEEAVEFVANLKLGRDERGDHVRKSRVREMLDLVGIPVKARTRPIGGTLAGGVVIRGLSGGERKRLALACAFAIKPKLIFLDEITSGLDSENAVVVIDLVKQLCVNMNVAAVVVIHQPSYEVFSHFDRLVMLCKGKCVFSDKLGCIPSFYDEIGRAFPEKYLLPADLLRAASEWKPDHQRQRAQANELIKSCGKKALKDIKERKKPTLGLQFRTVLVRHVMNHYVRNLTNLVARVFIYGLTAVLLGLVFWKIGESPGGQDLQPIQAEAAFGAGLFLTQTLFLLPFCQISTFFFDKNLFASESSIGLYPAWIYSLTQVVLETWVMSLCALVQSAIAIPMMSLWNMSISKLASFFTMFSVFCVGGIVGNSIVVLTSIVSFSQDFAFLLGSANVVTFLAMSGGFVPYPYMESWILWLQWISPIKYSFQAFTWSLLSGTSTSEVLDQLELNTPSNVSLNLVVLVGFFSLCSACSVVALARQKEVR